ncbi:MAG: hypothetical protein KJN93_10560, partial [Alphaproteobacteria bacterium]|nr:hypothetical protein [Alphaproteobacteria bacterium]
MTDRKQPSLFRGFLRDIIGIFAGILGPIALIFLGALMVGTGINYELGLIGWTGAALLGAGARPKRKDRAPR